MQTTITEALAEIKLIEKKVETKKTVVLGCLVQAEHVKDPFQEYGGSTKYLESEIQAIGDLEKRLETIRTRIAEANLSNFISVGETKKSIYSWLVWKRELAEKQSTFIKTLIGGLKSKMDEASNNLKVYDDADGKKQLVKWRFNLDYTKYLKHNEMLTQMVEELDGKLSLKNAIINIEY